MKFEIDTPQKDTPRIYTSAMGMTLRSRFPTGAETR